MKEERIVQFVTAAGFRHVTDLKALHVDVGDDLP